MKKTTKKAKATPKKNGRSIRKSIIELMTKKGIDNVSKAECEKLAKSIKKDTAWKDTHFYYYRKIVKQQIQTRKSRPKKKAKKGEKNAKA